MNCPECKAEMKALFTGSYCPNDCDRPDLKAKALAAAQAKAATPATWVSANGQGLWAIYKNSFNTIPIAGPPAAPWPTPKVFAPDECRKNYCGGKGAVTHTVVSVTRAVVERHYQCKLCASTWHEKVDANGNSIPPVPPPADPGFAVTWH